MRLPSHRPPTHPGEVLRHDFIRAQGLTQRTAAARLGISYARLNEIVNGRRGVTPDTALRLDRLFGASVEFWLNLQRGWDLWHALHSDTAKELDRIQPISSA